MKTAIWIIAICEIVRAAQNAIQLRAMRSEKGMRENAYQEFVKSLKTTDREFVKKMLEEFMNQEDSE
jgi:hypothetical protein